LTKKNGLIQYEEERATSKESDTTTSILYLDMKYFFWGKHRGGKLTLNALHMDGLGSMRRVGRRNRRRLARFDTRHSRGKHHLLGL